MLRNRVRPAPQSPTAETAAPAENGRTPAAVTDETPPALNDFGQYLDTTVQARAAALVELNSDTLVYGMNLDEKVYPRQPDEDHDVYAGAGARKPRRHRDGQPCGSQDLNAAGSSAGLLEGEQLSLRELLYCVMISSANEACNVDGGVHRRGYPIFRGAHERAGGGPRHDGHAFCQRPRPA